MMDRTLKNVFRKRVVKIFLTLGGFIFLVLIFYWNKTFLENTELFEEDSVLDVNDVFISVKTTSSFHDTRLKLLLDTWISTCKNQVSKYI
jgi:hypothetical protein